MATLTIGRGLDDWITQLNKLYDTSTYLGKAVYMGAKTVSKPMESELRNLPVDDRPYVPDGKMRKGIRSVEKAGLISSYGIAPMRDDNGFVNVKLGFDGYNKAGTPNIVVARALCTGTSFLPKNNFVDKVAERYKDASEKEMRKTIETEIKNICK